METGLRLVEYPTGTMQEYKKVTTTTVRVRIRVVDVVIIVDIGCCNRKK